MLIPVKKRVWGSMCPKRYRLIGSDAIQGSIVTFGRCVLMGPEQRKWRRYEMPKYIILGKFTAEGIKNIKDSPKRLAKASEIAESVGGKIKKFYYTMGRYDFVAICEAPDEEAMTKSLLTIGSGGAVSTETLTAISAEKGAEIIKSLP